MTRKSTLSKASLPRDAAPKSAEMSAADTANGENPDTDTDTENGADEPAHRTGERQAEENVENDPPA
jgi:hypothetical protein